MKKVLLSISALAAFTISAHAQQRLSLYEEFSGENCAPCAAANPGLWALLSANPSKVLLLKYQSPIPSAGPIYNLYPADYQNRSAYYMPSFIAAGNTGLFAPSGLHNGKILGIGQQNPGHVTYMTQAAIDADAAVASPFNITVTHAWDPTGANVTATVTVTAVSAYAPAGAQLKLRVALIEHLVYDTPPGTNGETDFHNVVRRMYPDGSGTTIPNAWTVGQSQTFTITGIAPGYVDKSGVDTRIVAWIQNDADKSIPQAAKSTPVAVPLDVASTTFNIPQTLFCTSGSTTTNATVVIKNIGATTVNAATVYYRVDNGTWQSVPYSGTLATGATATVNINNISLTPGRHIVYDSVALPNNQIDINFANNVKSKVVYVQNTTPNNLPLATGFENGGNMPTNYMLYDANDDGENWILVNGTGYLHNSSIYGIRHYNYDYAAGESNIAILPTPNMPAGAKALDFWVAYAQYIENGVVQGQDKLEVVYSTNCGSSWTPVWSQQGAQLATAPATGAPFVPTQNSNAQWRQKSADLSAVPSGAMIGFRATSDFGNNLYIDDINMRAGTALGIEEVVASGYVRMFPNPAKDKVTVEFTLNEQSQVQVQILDAAGRVVANGANTQMSKGVQKVDISTANLAAGIYNVKIQTAAGNRIERLTVVK